MISFALFPQASPPSMNFNISQLVFSRNRIFQPPPPPPNKSFDHARHLKGLKSGVLPHFLTFVVSYLNVWLNCKSFLFVWGHTLGWILLWLKARLHYSLNAIIMIQMVQYRQRGKFDRLQLWRTLRVWVGWGNILNTLLPAICRKEFNNYWWQECSMHHPPVFIKIREQYPENFGYTKGFRCMATFSSSIIIM